MKILGKKLEFTLKTKLTISYMLLVLFCILLIILLTNFLVSKFFREYVKENQIKKDKEIVEMIKLQYKNGIWNENAIETIGMNALEMGKIIRIYDDNNNNLWDAKEHNNGMCNRIVESMANNMKENYPGFEGKYDEIPYEIFDGNNLIGTILIGSYGPFYYNESDVIFINSLNRFIIIIGIIAFFIAIIFGNYIAKNISLSMLKVIKLTEYIAKGFYNKRLTDNNDIIEIKRLSASVNELANTLEKQDKLKKRLTQDIAHELRTPLATLQSHMEAMIDGIWKADKERLISCQDEIIRLKGLVGELEKLAKYEGSSLVLKYVEFDIYDLVKNIIKHYDIEFKNKSLKVNLTGYKTKVIADKNKINQVVLNILSNSIKYTNEFGNININIVNKNGSIELIFIDDGIGIPKEDLPYIFERFYRVDKSRSRLNGGYGIGLTIVKTIIEAHNGKISVERLKVGTKIFIKIPRQ
jgi:signal transduction histidine kinase